MRRVLTGVGVAGWMYAGWTAATPAPPPCGPPWLHRWTERLLPAATPADACAISNESWLASRAHNLDARWLVVLVRLESSGRRVHVWYPPRKPTGLWRVDLGHWQLHSTTALALDCDVPALLQYSVSAGAECAARVLADARQRCGAAGAAWVGCYHSSTPWRRDAYARKFWEVLP